MFEGISNFLAEQVVHYGYLIVFGSALLENSAFLGVIIPGDTILALTGFYSHGTAIKLEWLIPVAWLGAVIGDNIGYSLGRFGGRRLVKKFAKKSDFFKRRLEQAQGYFKSHGGKTVVTGRFVAFIRTFVPFTAGLSRMPYLRFIAFNVVGAGLQVTLLILLGYFFGSQWELLRRVLGGTGIVLLAVIIVVGVIMYRRRKAKSHL